MDDNPILRMQSEIEALKAANRELSSVLAKKLLELEAAYANLALVQARCTELLEERRSLARGIQDIDEDLEKAGKVSIAFRLLAESFEKTTHEFERRIDALESVVVP